MDTFERIRELLAEQLDIDEEKITMDSNILEDFEADSLDAVELNMLWRTLSVSPSPTRSWPT